MSTPARRDARFFVEGVTKYLRTGATDTSILPKVTAALNKITTSARIEKTALVETTVALTAEEKMEIRTFLSRLLTHAVILECRINKEVIGGLRIGIGDWVVDTTLAGQIEVMKEQLTS